MDYICTVASSTRVRITSPDRSLWPDDHITKQDLIDHYLAVGSLVLRAEGTPPYIGARSERNGRGSLLPKERS